MTCRCRKFKINHFQELEKRIECLEDILKDDLQKIKILLEKYLKPNTRNDMDRLEQRFRIIELKIAELKTNFIDKKPFRCPACEGTCTKIADVYPKGPTEIRIDCSVCEGKGIVWG